MGLPASASCTKAATDKAPELPMARTPILALASPKRDPASAMTTLASNGKSGIRI